MKFIWWTTLGYLSGMSFRFWRTVYFLRSSMTHLFLTVTCTVSILIAFENLIGAVKANQIHWPSPLNIMVNRKVWIEVLYTPLWYKSVKKRIKSYLRLPHPTLPNKIIIYSNVRTCILLLVEKMESYLDRQTELQTTCDVLILVGTQKMFINGIEGNGLNLNILALCYKWCP